MRVNDHHRQRRHPLAPALLGLLASSVSAQQGVLTNGNSQLPQCAQGCQLLQQAAVACGGQTTASQAIWECFCQSAYLTNLPNTDTGICNSVCTNPSDSQQVSTWYKSNCGSDHGASEHAAGAQSTSTTAAATTATTATQAGQTGSSSSAAAVGNTSNNGSNSGGSWFDTHWRWVVMIIVLAVGLSLFAAILIWVRRRYQRKRDQINGRFNTGITTRAPPMSTTGNANASFASMSGAPGAATAAPASSSAAAHDNATPEPGSPARTREAFMPYGYGYMRSESRLGYQAGRGSPLARGGTPVGELERADQPQPASTNTDAEPMPPAPSAAAAQTGRKSSRKVLVRERSMQSGRTETSQAGEKSGR